MILITPACRKNKFLLKPVRVQGYLFLYLNVWKTHSHSLYLSFSQAVFSHIQLIQNSEHIIYSSNLSLSHPLTFTAFEVHFTSF